MNDEIIYLEGSFAIIKSVRIFSTGFNCYKSLIPNGSEFKKINGPNSWFKTVEDAKKFIDEYKK